VSHSSTAAMLAAAPPDRDVRLVYILDFIREALDDAIDSVGVDNLVAQVDSLYDLYIAPLDIPYVPDHLEPQLVDLPVKQTLAALIRGFHKRIHTDN
jgi:hypothetical protein